MVAKKTLLGYGYLGFDQPDHVGCQLGSIRWSDDRCSSNANWELTMQLMRVQSSLQVAEIFWLQKNNKNDGLKPTSGCLIRQFCLQKTRDFTISHRDWRYSSESTTKCYNPNNIFMAIYIFTRQNPPMMGMVDIKPSLCELRVAYWSYCLNWFRSNAASTIWAPKICFRLLK